MGPPSRGRRLRSAAVLIVLALAACSGGGESQAGATPATSTAASMPASASVALDCLALVAKSPHAAAAALKMQGLQVSWRAVHTTSDGTAVADVTVLPPAGRIIDIILDGSEATIFVADPHDLAAQSPAPPTC